MEEKKLLLYIHILKKKKKKEEEKKQKIREKKAKKIIREQNKNNNIIPFGIEKISTPKYKLNIAKYYTRKALEEYFQILEIRKNNKIVL